MTTKTLKYELPVNTKKLEKELDEYIDKGYVVQLSFIETVTEHRKVPGSEVGQLKQVEMQYLVIVLHKYTSNIFGGPYTVNISGDV